MTNSAPTARKPQLSNTRGVWLKDGEKKDSPDKHDPSALPARTRHLKYIVAMLQKARVMKNLAYLLTL